MSVRIGILYVVATPIGNLLDLSPRAQQTLASVERVAAEDTRHSGALLRHFGIHTPLVSVHEHNERDRCAGLVGELLAGQSLALVSDAGTPLISDPGYHLVRAAQAAGIEVVAV
ncbi:MAG TPA: SAM-dependent methyltransferase, partial [Plasticicumulans sp.]|nr:SAM-dependent methyltransferase [Plasticicumulans sp.]